MTRGHRDKLWVGLARLALRRMSDRAAWQFYLILAHAYAARPDLAGEQ